MADLINPWAGKTDTITGKRNPLFLKPDEDSFDPKKTKDTIPPLTTKPVTPIQPSVVEERIANQPMFNAYGRWSARAAMAQGASGGPARGGKDGIGGYLKSDAKDIHDLRNSQEGWSGDKGVPKDPSTGRPQPFGVMNSLAEGQNPKMVVNNTIMTFDEAAKRFDKAPEVAKSWDVVTPVTPPVDTPKPPDIIPPKYFDNNATANATEQANIKKAKQHATTVSGLPVNALQNQNGQPALAIPPIKDPGKQAGKK